MPIHFELEADYVRVTCEADFDTAEVRTRCEEIARLHGSKSLLRVLVQDDDANFTPTPEELKAFAAVLSVAYRDVPVRIAVVAGNDVHFGMARLLGAFCEPPAMGYEVFREREAAECWLLGKPYPPAHRRSGDLRAEDSSCRKPKPQKIWANRPRAGS